MVTPHQVLQQYYGYSEFRFPQLEIINSILTGHDTLALLPTGAGKSVCFQVPGLIFGGTTVVISPLIALMEDQVKQLKKRGIRAVAITSKMGKQTTIRVFKELELCKYQFIYVAPERLENPLFVEVCQRIKIPLIAVDEAHCISQWGSTFRPHYRIIPAFIRALQPQPVVVGLTATAPDLIKNDILTNLELKSPSVFVSTFYRPNLRLRVIECRNSTLQKINLVRLIKKHCNQSGIIYVSSRKSSEQIARWLSTIITNKNSLEHPSVLAYHAGMSHEQRSYVQQCFDSHLVPVIVATTAFGMGIDVPDIRFVVHFHPPSNLEEYAQQIGRAGRDRLTGNCYTLLFKENFKINIGMERKNGLDKLKKLYRFLTQNRKCRYRLLLEYFGQSDFKHCYNCDICHPFYPSDHYLSDYLSNSAEIQRWTGLVKLRKKLSHRLSLTVDKICSDNVIAFMAAVDPINEEMLLELPGVGRGWVQKFGKIFAPSPAHS